MSSKGAELVRVWSGFEDLQGVAAYIQANGSVLFPYKEYIHDLNHVKKTHDAYSQYRYVLAVEEYTYPLSECEDEDEREALLLFQSLPLHETVEHFFGRLAAKQSTDIFTFIHELANGLRDDDGVKREIWPEVDDTAGVAKKVLDAWGLGSFQTQFLAHKDGRALLAHLCNAAAKRFDNTYYDYKPDLICLATSDNTSAWQGEGIIYIETKVGQVSFHVFEGEDDDLSPADGRVWCGKPNQWKARSMALGWLYHWPMWWIDLHAHRERATNSLCLWLYQRRWWPRGKNARRSGGTW